MTQLGWLLVKWATNRDRVELAVCMTIQISTKIWSQISKLEYLQSENSVKTNFPCIIVLNHRLVEYNAILCYLWTAFEMSWLVLVVFAFSGPEAARPILQQHVSAVNNTAAVKATTHERRARGWADQKKHFSLSAALPHRESNTTEILCCAYYNLPLRRFKQIVLLHFQVRVRCCRVQEVVLEIGCWLNAESQIPSTLLERGQPSD